MSTTAEFPHSRSEAFAEDVLDLVSSARGYETPRASARWLMNVVPVVVALLGVAFAVLQPLG